MDTVTLMKYHAGELGTEELILALSDMIKAYGLYNLDETFATLVEEYIAFGVLDDEGNIDYLCLESIV